MCHLGPSWAVGLAWHKELVLVGCMLIYTDLVEKGIYLPHGNHNSVFWESVLALNMRVTPEFVWPRLNIWSPKVMHSKIFSLCLPILGPQAQSGRNFDTLDEFVPNCPKHANKQSDSQVRADILTKPVVCLWFDLFWCMHKRQSLSLFSKNDVVSISVLVQSMSLQHTGNMQTYFFRALERRAVLLLF